MKNSIKIIRAESKNLSDIAPLFDAYRRFYNQNGDLAGAQTFLAERLSQGDAVLFVAYDGQIAVGFVQLYPSFSSVSMRPIWILNDLYVAEEARKQGVASQLMQAAESFAQETNAVRLELATETHNHAAQALYEKRGWVKVLGFYHYQFHID